MLINILEISSHVKILHVRYYIQYDEKERLALK